MPRFFIQDEPVNQVVIDGQDGRHIAKSLRMQTGQTLTLCNGQGIDFLCTIEKIVNDTVTVTVNSSTPCLAEPTVFVTLYQCLPKGDKMDSIVQKAVELGASRIVPVLSQRCVSRPEQKTAQKKVDRWQKIAVEAAKQCGRGILPTVAQIIEFSNAIQHAATQDTVLFCYEGGGQPLQQALEQTCKSCAILIGSEGGFEPQEAQEALKVGAKQVSLGPRILRTETAPVTALTAVMLLTGNLQ